MFWKCENANIARLKNEVNDFDRQCPYNMGMMGDILSVKYNEHFKEVQFYFSLNEKMVNIDMLKNNEQMIRQSVKLSFSRNESQEMVKMIINAGASLMITFKGSESGKSLIITLSESDLQDMLDNPLSESETNELLLENQLAMENSSCPYSIEKGIEMVGAHDDGLNVVYECRLDEDIYDIDVFKYAKEDIKNSMKEMFDDPVIITEVKLMKSIGRGLVYRYTGDKSSESVDITFSVEELKILVP
jgi:hypothetical protein